MLISARSTLFMSAPALTLLCLSLLSFICLTSTTVSAEETLQDNVNISVPVSCNLNSSVDTAHTAIVNAGTSVSDIGTTNFTVFCNDASGFALYAIGYTNEDYGNNTLVGQTTSNIINTGQATSGNTSAWAMKMIKVTDGSYQPNNLTITNNFNNYKEVPDTYTKVAEYTSSTDTTLGSKLQSTYRAFMSTFQDADTYNGKVKYTLVHPYDADPPTEPIECPSGYICYNPNSISVADSMGDQSVTQFATSVNLWASNFQKLGYGFAGWSDKFDWELNINDAAGNGTGVNSGYHIYGPNQTIEFTAGQYSGASGTYNGLPLYAVWVKSRGNLQSWNGCSSLSQGEVIALTDQRDNNTYAIAKLVDDRCWMIENLRLNSDSTKGETNKALTQGYGGVFSGLASSENANFGATNPPVANDLYKADNSGDLAGINGATLSDIGTDNYPYARIPRYNNENTLNPVSVMNDATLSTAVYSYGNYYNWAAAVASTSLYSNRNQSVTNTSLCPVGWHIPTGGSAYDSGSSGSVNVTGNPNTYSEFYNLGYAIMGITAYESNDQNTDGQSYYGASTPLNANGDTGAKAFRRFPNNFLLSGSFGSLRGSVGNYWTSTVFSSTRSYHTIVSSTVFPGTHNSGDKYTGLSVRCIADS